MNKRIWIELFLMTGIMAFIMSGSMLAFHFGLNEDMVKTWFQVYPIAWAIAIPGILVARMLVRTIMRHI